MKPTRQQLLEEIVRLKQQIDWWKKQTAKAKADMKRWRDGYLAKAKEASFLYKVRT